MSKKIKRQTAVVRELDYIPLTTPTTCYSASHRRGGGSSIRLTTPTTETNEDTSTVHQGGTIAGDTETSIESPVSLQLATESHILTIRQRGVDDSSHSDGFRSPEQSPAPLPLELESSDIPKDSPSMICVGYSRSQCNDANDNSTSKANHVLAICDSVILAKENSNLQNSNNSEEEDELLIDILKPINTSQKTLSSDDASVVSSSTHHTSTGGESRRASRRNSPTSTTAETTVTTVSNTTTTNKTEAGISNTAGTEVPSSSSNGNNPMDSLNASLTSMAANNTPTIQNSNTNTVSFKSSIPKARLILQTCEGIEYFTFCDFRPLAVCLAEYDEANMAVWVGSADDALLRCFVPNLETRRLDPLPLQLEEPATSSKLSPSASSDHLSTSTCVMAMDFLSVHRSDGTKIHTLVLACQDGTIRILSWEHGSDIRNSDDLKNATTVIVDGPIVALHLHEMEECPGRLALVAGSLCGYACRLYQDEESAWEGPIMVVQPVLRNITWNTEDSILAVHEYHDYVGVGTQSGRCLVYRRLGRSYELLWKVILPYSVHGICVLSTSKHTLQWIVTTRRSVHRFEMKAPSTKFRLEKARLGLEELSTKHKTIKAERDRIEQERVELERLEQERLEKEHLEQERLEEERLAKERQEIERIEEEKRRRESYWAWNSSDQEPAGHATSKEPRTDEAPSETLVEKPPPEAVAPNKSILSAVGGTTTTERQVRSNSHDDNDSMATSEAAPPATENQSDTVELKGEAFLEPDSLIVTEASTELLMEHSIAETSEQGGKSTLFGEDILHPPTETDNENSKSYRHTRSDSTFESLFIPEGLVSFSDDQVYEAQDQDIAESDAAPDESLGAEGTTSKQAQDDQEAKNAPH